MNFLKDTLNSTVADDFLGANGFTHPNLDRLQPPYLLQSCFPLPPIIFKCPSVGKTTEILEKYSSHQEMGDCF